jgi:rubrerythrin
MVTLPRRTTGRSRMTRRRFAVFEIKEILELAIRLEKNGEATYRKAMASCSDESMNALLQWMADEEVSHREWFAALKSDLDSGVKNPFIEEMSRQVFKDLVGGQSFSLKEVDFSKVGSTHELISIFIEFEQDTVLFYELIAPFIEDEETRGHLQRVIAEEKRHIDRLREFKAAGVAAR